LTRKINIKKYFYNIGLSGSQFINALIGGDPDESISGRCGKGARSGYKFWIYLSKIINFVSYPFDGPNHCEKSIERDEGAARSIIFR